MVLLPMSAAARLEEKDRTPDTTLEVRLSAIFVEDVHMFAIWCWIDIRRIVRAVRRVLCRDVDLGSSS